MKSYELQTSPISAEPRQHLHRCSFVLNRCFDTVSSSYSQLHLPCQSFQNTLQSGAFSKQHGFVWNFAPFFFAYSSDATVLLLSCETLFLQFSPNFFLSWFVSTPLEHLARIIRSCLKRGYPVKKMQRDRVFFSLKLSLRLPPTWFLFEVK